jgi:hypothetical protein
MVKEGYKRLENATGYTKIAETVLKVHSVFAFTFRFV